MGACPASRQEPGIDRIKLTDMPEREGAQEDTQRRRRPDAAEQPTHAATPEQVLLLIESAPSTMPATSAGTFKPGLAPLVSRHPTPSHGTWPA
jgi:hypothetical protein